MSRNGVYKSARCLAKRDRGRSKADFGAQLLTPDMAPFRAKAAKFYEDLKTKNTMGEGFWEVMEAIEKAR